MNGAHSTTTGTSDMTLNSVSPRTLSLRPKDAAAALGIGEGLLARLTKEGGIPCVRLGKRAVLYPVAVLEKWLADQSAQQGREGRP